jgi:hypothetical protein
MQSQSANSPPTGYALSARARSALEHSPASLMTSFCFFLVAPVHTTLPIIAKPLFV